MNDFPKCKHGKAVFARCDECESDARAGSHGGFTAPAALSSNLKNLAELISVMESAIDDGERNCQDLVRIHIGHISATLNVLRQMQSSVETACQHPLGALMYHGFVSGRVGDYRCDRCQTIVHLPSLDAREWAAARAEMKARSPAETTCSRCRGTEIVLDPETNCGGPCPDCSPLWRVDPARPGVRWCAHPKYNHLPHNDGRVGCGRCGAMSLKPEKASASQEPPPDWVKAAFPEDFQCDHEGKKHVNADGYCLICGEEVL